MVVSWGLSITVPKSSSSFGSLGAVSYSKAPSVNSAAEEARTSCMSAFFKSGNPSSASLWAKRILLQPYIQNHFHFLEKRVRNWLNGALVLTLPWPCLCSSWWNECLITYTLKLCNCSNTHSLVQHVQHIQHIKLSLRGYHFSFYPWALQCCFNT
jgi:hypothetical protein